MVNQAFSVVVLAVLAGSLARGETLTVPAGTAIQCRLIQTLSTKLNFQGDIFQATVMAPVVASGREAIPVGATVEGRIVRLRRPGRIRGVGEMRLAPERVALADGRMFLLSAILLDAYGAEDVRVADEEGRLKGPNSRKADLQEIGGGAVVGGAVGTAFGGFYGTVVGATVGGMAGLLDRLRRRGKDLVLPSGTQLNYQLTRDLLVEQDATRETAARVDAEEIE